MPKTESIKGFGPKLDTLLPAKHAIGTLAVDSTGRYAQVIEIAPGERRWALLESGCLCLRLLDARILCKGEGVCLFQE